MKKVRVECRDIHLAYGGTAVLKGVDIDIEPGEFFALLGPSGSGKSTLLRLVAGFARQQRGGLFVDGVDIGHQPPWQRNIGMVFQSYALWPHLNVWDNVAFGLVERRADRATIRARVGAALDLVGLGAYGQRRPGQLSGGQQQRVALARTIVIEPQVLLLDEPLSNLDKTLRVQMRQELLALQRRLGITTIFVTHDQEEAMTTADRMAVLDGGVVQQVGAPTALYDAPANPFVASFVGTMNFLAATVVARDAGGMTLAIDGVGERHVAGLDAQPAGDAVRLSFRPQAVRIATVGDEKAAEDHLWLPATVEASEFLGEFTRYRVRVGRQSLVVDQPHRAGLQTLASGRALALGVEAAQVRVFSG